MLRLMLLSALLLGLAPAAHARRFAPAPAPPALQAPSGTPVKQWLDCLDASGRPAKVYGWMENGSIRYWEVENPHLAARPQPQPEPRPQPIAPEPIVQPGPTVNYGVNLPSPTLAESTRTNDRNFAESMISEQEAAEASAPSPGGLLDRLRPKPKPCPGPGPCPPPGPDGNELPPEPESTRPWLLIGVGAVMVGFAVLALAAVVAFALAPKSSLREAPVHVVP